MLQILSHKPGSFVWKSEIINEEVGDYITEEIMDICIALSAVYDVTVWSVKEEGNDKQVARFRPRYTIGLGIEIKKERKKNATNTKS